MILNFYAHPDGGDAYAPYLTPPAELGPRLLDHLAATDPAALPYLPGRLIALRDLSA